MNKTIATLDPTGFLLHKEASGITWAPFCFRTSFKHNGRAHRQLSIEGKQSANHAQYLATRYIKYAVQLGYRLPRFKTKVMNALSWELERTKENLDI